MFKMFAWILSDRSSRWPKFRKEFLEKNPTCCACGTKKKLTVHHIVPVSVDSTKELEETNCMTLCGTCHFVFGHLHSYVSWNDNVRKDCEEHLKKVRSRPCHTV
jgi:5-methylcytosine-specific restriction endonuclease McrA